MTTHASKRPDPGGGWALTPGTRLLWRGDGSFALERADRGVVVAGLDRGVATSLVHRRRRAALPGPNTTASPTPASADAYPHAASPGPTSPHPPTLQHHDALALTRLSDLGYVQPVPPATDEQFGVDLAPSPRRRGRVALHGATGTAVFIGALLAGAGVGQVVFTSTGVVRRRDLLPGGLVAPDEGRRFAAAAIDAVHRASPTTSCSPLEGETPDLTIVCTEAPVEPELRDLLHHRGCSHLLVHVDGDRGEVGPLVIPGRSSCLRCADLHRLDRDPSWSVLAVQLLTAAGNGPAADQQLTARLSTLAVAVALHHLTTIPGCEDIAGDDGTDLTATGASWELRRAWAAPRRRRRLVHPDCDCGAPP